MGFRVIFVLCAHVVMVRQMRDVRGCVSIGLDCQIQAFGALGCSGDARFKLAIENLRWSAKVKNYECLLSI